MLSRKAAQLCTWMLSKRVSKREWTGHPCGWVTSAAPRQGTGARIIETRKTAPGLRVLDKWAVLIGGGANHRMGLFDMVMIKNNHVDAAGGISPAVRACTVRTHTLGHAPPGRGTHGLEV